MEKKLNAKTNAWISSFKKEIVSKILRYNPDPQTDLLQFIYNYPNLNFTNQDLQKRTRVKNTVPYHDRCKAMRANGEQCTRRKRADDRFCGTHIKGIPHGEITDTPTTEKNFKKVQVWAQDIAGIIRHLDNKGNVYDPQDIYQGNTNPKIIAKYTHHDGVYEITD